MLAVSRFGCDHNWAICAAMSSQVYADRCGLASGGCPAQSIRSDVAMSRDFPVLSEGIAIHLGTWPKS